MGKSEDHNNRAIQQTIRNEKINNYIRTQLSHHNENYDSCENDDEKHHNYGNNDEDYENYANNDENYANNYENYDNDENYDENYDTCDIDDENYKNCENYDEGTIYTSRPINAESGPAETIKEIYVASFDHSTFS